MICSINEIRAMLRRAAMGAGFPAGLADAIAAAGVWLCAHEMDGVGAVLDALEDGYDHDVAMARDGNTLTFSNARIGRCGSSAFELIAAGSADRVIVTAPDSALLLRGMAGISSDDERSFVLSTGVDGQVEIVASAPAVEAIRPLTAVDVDERRWAEAGVLAARILVPATDESRSSGAGAGLTDND